jgi:hypothetical protein
MVRWSDELFGGVIAGFVSALFFLFCGVAIVGIFYAPAGLA